MPPDPQNPLLGGTSAPAETLAPGVIVNPNPIKSGAEPMQGDSSVTPSGQPIPPAGLDKTDIRAVEPGVTPTEAPPLNSQLEQQHADPRATEIVEKQLHPTEPTEPPIPLRPGDVIQGPGDRKNRRPNENELKTGEDVYRYNLSDEEIEALESQKFAVIDPPIDENAPKDVPADPRKVAESRGIKFPESTTPDSKKA